MDLMTRRRALMARVESGQTIGYKLGYSLNSDNCEEITDRGYFVTGYIPFTATNNTIKLTGKYSNAANFYDGSKHWVVFCDNQKNVVASWAYYDMTEKKQRSITNTSPTLRNGTAYIRFVGREDSIDDCFVRDDATGIILWQKGM